MDSSDTIVRHGHEARESLGHPAIERFFEKKKSFLIKKFVDLKLGNKDTLDDLVNIKLQTDALLSLEKELYIEIQNGEIEEGKNKEKNESENTNKFRENI